jgi:hypothetical protein
VRRASVSRGRPRPTIGLRTRLRSAQHRSPRSPRARRHRGHDEFRRWTPVVSHPFGRLARRGGPPQRISRATPRPTGASGMSWRRPRRCDPPLTGHSRPAHAAVIRPKRTCRPRTGVGPPYVSRKTCASSVTSLAPSPKPALPASAASAPREQESVEVVMPPRQRRRTSTDDGGGGNRTRVRGRTGQSVYKRRLPLKFARRPVGSRPTAGLVILWVSHLGR